MRRPGRTIASVALLAALFGGAAATQRWLTTHHPHWRPGPNDWIYLPKPALFRVTSLGFRQLAADLLWFRLVQAVGDTSTRVTAHGFKWLYEYVDLVTDVDERYPHAYFMASHWLVTWNRPREALAILDKGRERFRGTGLADYYKFPYYMGLYSYLYLRDKGEAIRYLEEAVDAKEASGRPGGTQSWRSMMDRIESGAGETFATMDQIFSDLLATAETREERQALQPLLRHGRFFSIVQQVNPVIARFAAEHGRNPASLEELAAAGYLRAVPDDPYRRPDDPRPEGLVIDDEGRLRSTRYPGYWWERGASGRKLD